MRALVVYCHPKESSFTAAVRDTVLDRLARAGVETRLRQELLDPDRSPARLVEWTPLEAAVDPSDLESPPEGIAESAWGRNLERCSSIRVGDRLRLLEVYQNLIDNAVKFLGEQESPRIEVGAREGKGDSREVLCWVKDNGAGIDPRYLDKVFGLFERLDQQVPGTGVGLALVKRIVEVHGGRAWVESEGAGRGSTFFFTLPPG